MLGTPPYSITSLGRSGKGDYIKDTYSRVKGKVRVEFMVKQSRKNTGFEADQKS